MRQGDQAGTPHDEPHGGPGAASHGPADRTLSVDVTRRFETGATIEASFDAPLDAGSILVLFGPSGSGKTTLLRAIAGLDRPDRGRIVFEGEAWFDADHGHAMAPQQRQVGYVTQDSTLFPHLTVRQNIAYGMGLPARVGSHPTLDLPAVASLCGVADLLDRRPSQLSGGQAQRVAVARALARRPRLLLLDEPFASLDLPSRVRLRSDLRSLLARVGVPAVLVTHDRNDALAIGDFVAVLAGGRLHQLGSATEVFSAPSNVHVATSIGVETIVPAVVDEIDQGLLRLRIGPATLHAVAGETIPAVGARVFACIRAEDVLLEPPVVHAPASARNRLNATVVAVTPEGAVDRLTLDCGFPLVAVVTRQSRQEMRLQPQSAVMAMVKATAIHVVPRE
jgi:molybdate transport system ATP-binding protein